MDDGATPDHVDSTFLDHFERDLGVLPAIHDGVHPHGGPVPECGVPSASQDFVSVDAVVPAGVVYNGRFAVLAEEDNDEEVMLEVRACRRRVAASPSLPPTAVDLVRPTEVDMESASEVGVPEAETESILSAVPKSEVGSVEEGGVRGRCCTSDDQTFSTHPRRVHQFGHGECAGGHHNQELCDEGASNILPRCMQVCHEVGVARDRQVPKPFAHSERLETVHIDPENAVVPTGTRRQSSEKPVVGQVEQVCQRQWLDLLGKAKKRRRMQQGCDRERNGTGWTMWRRVERAGR